MVDSKELKKEFLLMVDSKELKKEVLLMVDSKELKNILRLVVKKSLTGESTHYFFFMLK